MGSKFRRAFHNRLSSSQRPATRKDIRRTRVRLSESRQEIRGAEDLNVEPDQIRKTVAKVLAKSPQVVSARWGLPSILSPQKKSKAEGSEAMQIIVTRGRVKTELLSGDYENNMNLQSYDFNQKQRIESKAQRQRNGSFKERAPEIRPHRRSESLHKASQSCLPSPHKLDPDCIHTPRYCPPAIPVSANAETKKTNDQQEDPTKDKTSTSTYGQEQARQMGHSITQCLRIEGNAGQALRRLLQACAAKNRFLRRASEANEPTNYKPRPYPRVDCTRKLEVLLPSDYGWP